MVIGLPRFPVGEMRRKVGEMRVLKNTVSPVEPSKKGGRVAGFWVDRRRTVERGFFENIPAAGGSAALRNRPKPNVMLAKILNIQFSPQYTVGEMRQKVGEPRFASRSTCPKKWARCGSRSAPIQPPLCLANGFSAPSHLLTGCSGRDKR